MERLNGVRNYFCQSFLTKCFSKSHLFFALQCCFISKGSVKKKKWGEREGKEKTSKFLIKNHEKDCFEITFKIHNLLLVQGKLVEF